VIRIFALLFLVGFALSNELCERLKTNADEIFASKKDFYGLTDEDFRCDGDEFIKPFLDITMRVRGLNIDCDGHEAIKMKRNFRYLIQTATYAPKIYQRNLLDANSSDEKTRADRDYLKYWAYKNLTSYELYSEFNHIYRNSVSKFVEFYKNYHGFNDGDAIFFANRVATEFLNFAVFNHKNRFKLSKLERFVLNKNLNSKDLLEFLHSNDISQEELNNALKIVILDGKNLDIIKILLKQGANLNYGNESAIFSSLRNPKITEFLISQGADVNYKNSFGKTPLFYAIEFGNFPLIEMLVNSGADINAKYISNYEKMALMASNRFPFYVKLCGLNHTSRTVLMHAAQKSNLEIVKYLINLGTNVNAVDDLGFNALDYAIAGGKRENAAYLMNLGLTKRSNYE